MAAWIGVALVATGVAVLGSTGLGESNDQRVWRGEPVAPAQPRLIERPAPQPAPPRRSRATPTVSSAAGYLSVNSSPWSQLSVDGHVVGSTPQVRIRVSPGRHHLVLVRDGFQTQSAWVVVPAGGTVRLTDITLPPVAR